MTIPDHLLDILCCPVSHEPLRPLSRNQLKKLNQAIADGGVQYVDGSGINHALSEGLISRDNKVVYEVEDGIPVLLPERAIGTTQFNQPL